MNATALNAKTQDKLDMVVLRDTCEDSTAMNGRQEYHGKGSCGVARHCIKNLNGPEEDLVILISWNLEDNLD